MQCFVYRSRKQYDMYLYVVERDKFDHIPEALMKKFGTPEFAMDFDFSPDRKLAKEDPKVVRDNLNTQGFHLQMPDKLDVLNPIDSKYH